ncbi:tryptophan-rich sensory protein [Dietzia alimentaria]|uniref:tryptophan-rich sensory protein n=1 Tax=Dietzia alimentaria TaxID=665550 RepID=UPI00029AD841
MPVLTLLGVTAAIIGAFVGSGALGGTPIAEAAGGALSADATPVAPAGAAFSIWSVIYLGLLAYALWQLTPTARGSSRQRTLRPWALASVLLNAAWIWAIQLDAVAVSVSVIVVLLAVLIRAMFVLGAPRAGGVIELTVVDGTFGLYLGWVTVATLANAYAWLVASGVEVVSTIAAGIVGVIAAMVVGIATALLSRGRVAPAVATSWGLAWIAVGRTEGAFASPALAWTAAIGTLAVLLVALLNVLRT